MKKQILILALVLVGITGSSFATGTPDVNKYAERSFNQQFAGAHDAKWEDCKTFVKVSFEMENQSLFAYYSNNGELLGVSRYISTTQLPVQLLITLKKQYSGYWISDLFEVHVNDDTSYYVTVENGSQKKVLKSYDSVGWGLFRTIAK
jgi:hypothetical protein